MAAQKNSLLMTLLLFSCACSGQSENVVIDNHIEGCFTLSSLRLDSGSEPVLLHAKIDDGAERQECPCTSALFKYTAYQESRDGKNSLISGYFTTLQKEVAVLPISVQKQLIFSGVPIRVDLACSGL
jgi:hypothetical protein